MSGSTVQDTGAHFPQLDGLRAIAALAVLVQHSTPLPQFNVGGAGVRLFFVLSGFLITGILLRQRDSRASRSSIATRFYGRRALRIFPLFYFALLVAVVFQLPGIEVSLPWHLAYASNFLVARSHDLGDVDAGYALGHFWSLAVEEQFYLVWPAVILLTPARWLTPVMLGMIACGPLSRAVLVQLGHHGAALHVLPTTCLDSLGLGALLAAFFHTSREKIAPLLRSWKWGLAAVTPFIALLSAYLITGSGYRPYIVLEYFTMSLAFMWIVGAAAIGFRGPVGWLLESWPLAYLGRISYGIYVYQGLVPALLVAYGWYVPEHGTWQLLVFLPAVTIPVAALSWHLFEKPLNDLKRYSPYPERARQSVRPSPELPR